MHLSSTCNRRQFERRVNQSWFCSMVNPSLVAYLFMKISSCLRRIFASTLADCLNQGCIFQYTMDDSNLGPTCRVEKEARSSLTGMIWDLHLIPISVRLDSKSLNIKFHPRESGRHHFIASCSSRERGLEEWEMGATPHPLSPSFKLVQRWVVEGAPYPPHPPTKVKRRGSQKSKFRPVWPSFCTI